MRCHALLCYAVLQDPLYKPLLGQLARVSFFSAAIHQLVFTIFSTLPFAVGQPQVGQGSGSPTSLCCSYATKVPDVLNIRIQLPCACIVQPL